MNDPGQVIAVAAFIIGTIGLLIECFRHPTYHPRTPSPPTPQRDAEKETTE